MMVGRHPFGDSSADPQAFMRRQMHEELPSLAEAARITAYVDEVIRRITANDPLERFGNMWAVGRALLELRRRLVGDPAALARVLLKTLEQRSPLLLDATGRQGYQAPQELMGAVVAAAVKGMGKTEPMGAREAARARVTPATRVDTRVGAGVGVGPGVGGQGAALVVPAGGAGRVLTEIGGAARSRR